MSQSTGASAGDPWPEKTYFSDAYGDLPQVAPLFTGWWPEPDPARRWVALVAGGVGLLAALLLPGVSRPGINLLICGLAAALPVGVLAYQRGRRTGRRWAVGRVPVALGMVALGLAAVSAVRASEWLAWGCLAAACCLGAAAALDVRRWLAVFATVPLFGIAVLRALPWAGRTVQFGRFGRMRGLPRPWLTGLGIGAVCTAVVAGLLASADAAFSELLTDLLAWIWPSFDVRLLPARMLTFVASTATVLGALFAVSAQFTPGTVLTRRAETATRHPAEWLTPLVLVAITIAAFLAVEATMLFGGADVVQRPNAVSHAERAREGFGQLTVVTVIVLVLLAWAGSVAAGSAAHRRLMAVAGGALLVLALLLGASALRRLWLYQDAYGWTVTRLNAGAFEIWIAVVLAGFAAAWLFRRTDLIPRFLIGSAGLGLLVVGMAGPDALVATANVDRFKHGREINVDIDLDTEYLSRLSADAVPALNRLPEPERSRALAKHAIAEDPWFGWNLSRSRANRLLSAPR
jgi:hypothetical protein